MISAKLENGTEVFIHDGRTPAMDSNSDKVIVSKQPNSNCIFAISSDKLTLV